MLRLISINKELIAIASIPIMFSIMIFSIPSEINIPTQFYKAVSLDLLITIPVIYFVLIRKSKISKITIIPVLIIGLLVGYFVIPKGHHDYLDVFRKFILPIIELSVISFVIYKVRTILKSYLIHKDKQLDFYDALIRSCHEILPHFIAHAFATEIAVVYYGFINYSQAKYSEREFSYHKSSGSMALFGALVFIIGIETFAVHMMLHTWSATMAWFLSALSVYGGIQFLGFARSMSKRPIVLMDQSLLLRYGILSNAEILYEDILRVELSRKSIDGIKSTIKLSPLGDLEMHNVILHLKKQNEISGFYGIKKGFMQIAFYVDDKIVFQEQLNQKLQLK